MAIAGSRTECFWKTDSGSWTEMKGVNSVSVEFGHEFKDITTFENNAGFMRKMKTLSDASFTLSGFFTFSDVDGQEAMRLALGNSDHTYYFKIEPDGGTDYDFYYTVLVENFKLTGEVDNVQEFSCTLKATSALTT